MKLKGTDLRGINFFRSKLDGTDLRYSKLSNTSLREATVVETDFDKAGLASTNLCDTDLTAALNLTADQIRSAENWRKDLLPDYLKDELEAEEKKEPVKA